jgi:hypothetical protein
MTITTPTNTTPISRGAIINVMFNMDYSGTQMNASKSRVSTGREVSFKHWTLTGDIMKPTRNGTVNAEIRKL